MSEYYRLSELPQYCPQCESGDLHFEVDIEVTSYGCALKVESSLVCWSCYWQKSVDEYLKLKEPTNE